MRPDGKNTVMKGLTEKEVLHMAQHKKYYIWLNRKGIIHGSTDKSITYCSTEGNITEGTDSYAKSFARVGEL